MSESKYTIVEVLDQPEPGWLALNMPRRFGDGRSFVSGETEGDRLLIYYYLREADQALTAKVWFGLGAEGPPGSAHGGSMAAVLDESMGFVCWVRGHPVVAAGVSIKFKKRLPLDHLVFVEAAVVSAADGKVFTRGRIYDPRDERTFCEAEGTFIEQPLVTFGALDATMNMNGRRPSE